MGRPKLPKKDKKVKLGITISREINEKIDGLTHNKSSFIESIIQSYFNSLKK